MTSQRQSFEPIGADQAWSSVSNTLQGSAGRVGLEMLLAECESAHAGHKSNSNKEET
jgi:hypothetical protein